MKKIILTTVLIFYFGTANSQINNLNEYLTASELTIEDLNINLQNTWKINSPKHQVTNGGKQVTDSYYYLYHKNNMKQMLKRTISVIQNTNLRLENTELWSNDLEALKRIIKELPYDNYKLVQREGVRSLYQDGYRNLLIQTASTLNLKLPDGSYYISIMPILSDSELLKWTAH